MENVNLPRFLPSEGLSWKGVLNGTPKATDVFQPIFEGITNSLESIELRKHVDEEFHPYIYVDFFFNTDLAGNRSGLSKLMITDNGIGFDDVNFKRLQIYKDESKGFNNRGSGRLQLLHSFQTAKYESVYKKGDLFWKRVFTLSKSLEYLDNNAILKIEDDGQLYYETKQQTRLTLDTLREKVDSKVYADKSIDEIKSMILNHYIMQLCAYGSSMPSITIKYFHHTEEVGTRFITIKDLPDNAAEDQFIEVPMCTISADMKRIEKLDEKVTIGIKSFKLPSSQFKKNAVKLTSKKEIVDSVKLRIACLPDELEVDSSRFLFLLSSEYFDKRIGDVRDSFDILNKTDFKKKAKQFGSISPQIVLDDIEERVSEKASDMFSEISKQKEIHQNRLLELKDTYLLSDEALADASIDDSVEDILQKAYTYDAKLIAKRDAEYQEKCKELDHIDTTSPTYKEDLENIVTELTKSIPLQCKESLSRYITHRTLILNLFDKLIHKETDIQKKGERSMDEKLIHNLLFAQHEHDSSVSDIWMLNEDYLYYRGYSENRLIDIEIEGKKLFKDEVSKEEEKYLKSLGEDRLAKRPDILLFPAEHKCIIIELKSLDANLSKYLHQINQYATFLRSYTTDDFYIDTFYGYLIGEAIEPNDIRAADSDFKYDPKFNYCYRPSKTIACLSDPTGAHDGQIYTEALSFSVMLIRAVSRNESFKQRLFPNVDGKRKDSEEKH